MEFRSWPAGASVGSTPWSSRDLLVAQGSESFASAVLRLLEDPQLRRATPRPAVPIVTEHHDWAQLLGRLEALVVGDLAERAAISDTAHQPNHQSPQRRDDLIDREHC